MRCGAIDIISWFTWHSPERAGARQRPEDNGFEKRKQENVHSEGHAQRQSFLWADKRAKDSGGIIGESKGTVQSLHLVLPVLVASIGTVAGVITCVVKSLGTRPCVRVPPHYCLLKRSHYRHQTNLSSPNQLLPRFVPTPMSGLVASSPSATSRLVCGSSAATNIVRRWHFFRNM